MSMLKVVVLPAPLTPNRPKHSPSGFVGLTCEHAEGGGLASAVHSQQAKALPFRDAQPQAVHGPHWGPEAALAVLLLQALQQNLPLLLPGPCSADRQLQLSWQECG